MLAKRAGRGRTNSIKNEADRWFVCLILTEVLHLHAGKQEIHLFHQLQNMQMKGE